MQNKNTGMPTLVKIKTCRCLLVITILLYSCRTVTQQKTNVLTRTPAPQAESTKVGTSREQARQTVFVKSSGKLQEALPSTVNKNENALHNIEAETISLPDFSAKGRSSSQLVYKSPQYYLSKADSVQLASARNVYERNFKDIVNQMAKIPSQNENPAVNAEQFYATPNFSIRKPNFVILHHTGQQSKEQAVYTFCVEHSGVSAHYIVGKDGTVFQMLNDYLKAWHAGASQWGNISDLNSCSIGIELDNNGVNEAFSEIQISALLELLSYLKKKYLIPTANFIGHSDIASGRKFDPSKYFPWEKLAAKGFGFWYDKDKLTDPPPSFDALWALRTIGYSIRYYSS